MAHPQKESRNVDRYRHLPRAVFNPSLPPLFLSARHSPPLPPPLAPLDTARFSFPSFVLPRYLWDLLPISLGLSLSLLLPLARLVGGSCSCGYWFALAGGHRPHSRCLPVVYPCPDVMLLFRRTISSQPLSRGKKPRKRDQQPTVGSTYNQG